MILICVFRGYDCAGGFGGNVGHDPHVLYTLSAVQVLCLFDRLDVLDADKVADCILPEILRVSFMPWQ